MSQAWQAQGSGSYSLQGTGVQWTLADLNWGGALWFSSLKWYLNDRSLQGKVVEAEIMSQGPTQVLFEMDGICVAATGS